MSIHTCQVDEFCVVLDCDLGWGGSRLDMIIEKLDRLEERLLELEAKLL